MLNKSLSLTSCGIVLGCRCWTFEASQWCTDVWISGCPGDVGNAEKIRIRADKSPSKAQAKALLEVFSVV